jgi:hypothetical protein
VEVVTEFDDGGNEVEIAEIRIYSHIEITTLPGNPTYRIYAKRDLFIVSDLLSFMFDTANAIVFDLDGTGANLIQNYTAQAIQQYTYDEIYLTGFVQFRDSRRGQLVFMPKVTRSG